MNTYFDARSRTIVTNAPVKEYEYDKECVHVERKAFDGIDLRQGEIVHFVTGAAIIKRKLRLQMGEVAIFEKP